MEPGIPFSRLSSTETVSNEDELLLQQDNKTKRISYEDLKKPIEAETGNDIDLSIDESTVSLIATLKNKEGETIAEASVPLPNTTDLDMSVAEETAELTVSLKNKAGEVVTTATVQLPNTSNLEMSIDENNVLTTALKNKSGAVVTSDSVTIPAVQSRDVTWAEYEALPDSKLTDGVYYNIIDRNTMPDSEEIQGNKNFLGTVKVQGEDVVTKNKLNNAENLGVIGSNGTITLTKSLDEFNMIVLIIDSGSNADSRSNAITVPTLLLKNRNNENNCFEISVFNSPSYYASAFVYAPDNAHVVVSASNVVGWNKFQIGVFGII